MGFKVDSDPRKRFFSDPYRSAGEKTRNWFRIRVTIDCLKFNQRAVRRVEGMGSLFHRFMGNPVSMQRLHSLDACGDLI
jgi:hypothetical protein